MLRVYRYVQVWRPEEGVSRPGLSTLPYSIPLTGAELVASKPQSFSCLCATIGNTRVTAVATPGVLRGHGIRTQILEFVQLIRCSSRCWRNPVSPFAGVFFPNSRLPFNTIYAMLVFLLP